MRLKLGTIGNNGRIKYPFDQMGVDDYIIVPNINAARASAAGYIKRHNLDWEFEGHQRYYGEPNGKGTLWRVQ